MCIRDSINAEYMGIGYYSGCYVLMTAAVPLLTFFGGGGLFVFGWKKYDIPAQIGHILMCCAISWIIYTIISQGMYQSAFYGLLLTAVMDTSFIAIQQQHCAKNWDRFMELMKDPFKNKQGQFYLSIHIQNCLLYTSPSPRDLSTSRMPSSA
eukprot:TRINITY_DN17283_c0_g1_i1.p1 TRINITY_DN17283_c0_g1~~TRINITY_DN17283_c0_g1_i1.p1  ORF type:complete len:152 (-),score=17.25 TRINITY_DN17283_c0_g1_i1:102-557(-)